MSNEKELSDRVVRLRATVWCYDGAAYADSTAARESGALYLVAEKLWTDSVLDYVDAALAALNCADANHTICFVTEEKQRWAPK